MNNSKIIEIFNLTDSEECLILENLAKLDLSIPTTNDVDYKSPDYFDNYIFKKFFRETTNTNRKTIEYHLKNKYLYYLTGGTIAYLEAIYSMNGKYEIEIQHEVDSLSVLLTNELHDGLDTISDYDLVSLGSGDGKKDIKLISSLYGKKAVNYFPIDISFSLLQLTINKFKKRFEKGDKKIIPINGDFFDLDEELKIKLQNYSPKPKIFTLLGSTIGNYKEDDLLKEISKIMGAKDYLIISFEVFDNDDDLRDIISQYYTNGNLEFLTYPLKLIPKYSGYLQNRTKYFKLVQNKFESGYLNPSITIFEESKVYKPKLEIPHKKLNMVVAWSTKYNEKNIIETIEEKLLGFKIIATQRKENKVLVLLQKKENTVAKGNY